MDQSPAAAVLQLAVNKQALISAVRTGDTETVIDLLDRGVSIDTKDDEGNSLLHFAAWGGHVTTMRLLIRRGCDVDLVNVRGLTPQHWAAAMGQTKAVRELIRLGAIKSVVAGNFGTPLHQAALNGHVETVEAMLAEGCPIDVVNSDGMTAVHWAAQCGHFELMKVLVDRGCDVNAVKVGNLTPVMYAVPGGHVEVFRLLTSKGGAITDRDSNSLSTFEHCFVGGHASKLNQLCEACDIRSSGEGLRGALATLIMQGLVDAHKVLCLCAIPGDSVFLEEQFIELIASDVFTMPAAVKCAKYYFCRGEGISFLNQLSIPDENALNPLRISLLSMKCFALGFAQFSIQMGSNDHKSFITKLLSHRVLKETVNEVFPNGLSPLDLARQFEFHDIAALIEGAGGGPGVWANVPQEVFLRYHSEIFMLSASLKVCDTNQGGDEVVKKILGVVISEQIVDSTILVDEGSQLTNKQVWTDGIVSELGGAHQVSVQCCVLSEGAVWCAVWRRQVLLSCRVLVFVLLPSPSLNCLLSSPFLLSGLPPAAQALTVHSMQ